MHKEEVQRNELEKAEVMLKKLEKKAMLAENSRKKQRMWQMTKHDANYEKHDKSLQIAKDFEDSQARVVNQMKRKTRQVEQKLKLAEELREKEL